MNRTNVLRRTLPVLVAALSLPLAVSAAHATDTPRSQELRGHLAAPVKFPGFDDPNTTLTEALDALAKRYDLNFDLNEHALKEAGLKDVHKFEIASPNPVPEMNARLETVLKKVLGRVSPRVTFVIRDDHIEVTTREAIRREFYPGRTEEVLPPLVYTTFEGKPLAEALKELSQGSGLTVLLDGRAAKEARTPVTADLMNVPLDTAVRLLADMAGLKVVPVDAVLYVTTAENACALREEQEKSRLETKRDQEKKAPEPARADKPAAPSPGDKH
jgi:hypothetical protein